MFCCSQPGEKLRKRDFKTGRQYLQRTEAGFFFPVLKVRDECTAQSRVDGKIRLRPSAPLTQGANATAEPNTDVSCHGYSIAVFFRLHIAYRVQTLWALPRSQLHQTQEATEPIWMMKTMTIGKREARTYSYRDEELNLDDFVLGRLVGLDDTCIEKGKGENAAQ